MYINYSCKETCNMDHACGNTNCSANPRFKSTRRKAVTPASMMASIITKNAEVVDGPDNTHEVIDG